MFERFTERTRQTLFEARKEAVRQSSSYIETEHVLVGLMTVRALTTGDLSNARLTTDAICTHRDELDAPRSIHAVAGVPTGHLVRAGEKQPTPKPGEAFSQESQRVLNVAFGVFATACTLMVASVEASTSGYEVMKLASFICPPVASATAGRSA
jgi:hypothetical protein